MYVFGGFLEETVQSVHTCGGNVENSKNLMDLGYVVHNNDTSRQESQSGLVWPSVLGTSSEHGIV